MASSAFPILIVAPERIDDAILSSGLIRRLADEAPHARFVVAAGADVAPLYRDIPGLDRIVPFEPQAFGLHWLALWGQARRRRWGLVLDLRGGGRFARLLSARRRAVKRPSSSGAAPVHKVIEAARLVRLEDEPPAPFLFTGPETEARAAALMKPAAGLPNAPDGPILALAPAADWVGRAWPAERFAVLAAEMLGPGGPMARGRLLLLGGAGDGWATETVRRAIARERQINAVGQDLLVAYACLKRARLFIGVDNPYLHLAAAAGAPTLGLFGPSDERVYGPWGPQARVLRGPRDFATFKALDPGFSQAMNHMQDLSTSKVTAAARRLMAETEPDQPAPGE